ncbi:MAG TPA: sensor domain-containing diguanylate cyclase [Kofleriaceae bacterium]|nr:sensor domain-containing diguanylate cyclase [Kofleriaceae bacterium]
MKQEQLARLPQVLFEIGKAIGSDDELGALLARISELVCELAGADACSIMLLDQRRQRLLGKAAHGLSRSDLSGISFEVGQGVAGWVADRGEAALIDDVSADPRYQRLPDSQNHIRSLACVPIAYRDERIGVLTITSCRTGAFSQDDLDLLRFITTTVALDIDNARLRRLALTDPLTEAYNREFLQQHLPRVIELADQRGEPLAVAMVDIDHFKEVNDQFGHEIGDRVLTDVANRLRAAIRAGDLLIRYGGEEFLALLPGASIVPALEIAERMRARLEGDPIAVDGKAIAVRISVGVAERRRGADSSVELIRRADQALYAAKRSGRNRVEVAA